MFAVIYRSPSSRRAGALPLAGPALIVRQLQWLRSAGYEKVALDLGQDDLGEEVRRRLAGHEVLVRSVVFLYPSVPLSPRALGERAGFPEDAQLLALPESVIGSADLRGFHQRSPNRGVRVGRLAAPKTGGPFQPGEVHLVSSVAGPVVEELLHGWGASVGSPGAALRLSCEALLGRLPSTEGGPTPSLLLHAAEQAPGVWVARGGRIQKGAVVHPPVLVGADALVCSGARIGPGALIGARAIIEAGALIEHALVGSDTVVGEGLEVRETLATPEGLASLDGDAPALWLGDPLLLSRRQRTVPLAARLLRLFSLRPASPAEEGPADQEGVRRDSRERAATGSGSRSIRSSARRR